MGKALGCPHCRLLISAVSRNASIEIVGWSKTGKNPTFQLAIQPHKALPTFSPRNNVHNYIISLVAPSTTLTSPMATAGHYVSTSGPTGPYPQRSYGKLPQRSGGGFAASSTQDPQRQAQGQAGAAGSSNALASLTDEQREEINEAVGSLSPRYKPPRGQKENRITERKRERNL